MTSQDACCHSYMNHSCYWTSTACRNEAPQDVMLLCFRPADLIRYAQELPPAPISEKLKTFKQSISIGVNNWGSA